jgi:Family of unknown function (DUF6006)
VRLRSQFAHNFLLNLGVIKLMHALRRFKTNARKMVHILGLALGFLFMQNAFAEQAAQRWYLGHWDCKLALSSMTMDWKVVEASSAECKGNACTSNADVKVLGSSRVSTGPAVKLIIVSASSKTLSVRDEGGATFLLNYQGLPAGQKLATGSGTIGGVTDPLRCSQAQTLNPKMNAQPGKVIRAKTAVTMS